MAAQNLLIMNLLRIITPEEIADIATKHNGGKFLSLTELVNERVEKKIYRDFSGNDSMETIHGEHTIQRKEARDEEDNVLPFKLEVPRPAINIPDEELLPKFVAIPQAITTSQKIVLPEAEFVPEKPPKIEHKEDENMSSFILIEKERLKKSQKALKQKEILSLYQKNSNIDVEQIKTSNKAPGSTSEDGVLINKKQY
jgi:hypothetical protein